MRTALKWTAGILVGLVVALALFISFGLDTLRGPIARAVSNATGRELVIDGKIRTVWGRVPSGFRGGGGKFGKPGWGRGDYFFRRDAVEAEVRLLPLLRGLIVLPEVRLEGAEV